MKKFLSLLLIVVMLFSLGSTAYAAQDEASKENVFFDANTEIGHVKVTYTQDSAGSLSMYEYHNGTLAVMTKYTPGNTYYERLTTTQNSLRSSAWEVVDFPAAFIENSSSAILRADSTRQLGYMHYNNTLMGEILSIRCYVDEWYSPQKKVMISGTWGTIVDLATFVVGAIGLPAAIASGVVSSLLYAGIVGFVGNTLKTLVSTEVTANVVEQRIYGECTSHTGKPLGDLGDARIIYVTTNNSSYAGETFYEGYTTHDWGTSSLGRMMFWKVFGVEYTPTSWTGVYGMS